MENADILSFILNGVLAMAIYFMQQAQNTTKEKLVELRDDVEHVKDKYFKKEDFRDFKQELWSRLDKMEESIKGSK